MGESLGLSQTKPDTVLRMHPRMSPLGLLPASPSMHLGSSQNWASGSSCIKWWLWDTPQTVAMENKWEHLQLSAWLAHKEPLINGSCLLFKKNSWGLHLCRMWKERPGQKIGPQSQPLPMRTSVCTAPQSGHNQTGVTAQRHAARGGWGACAARCAVDFWISCARGCEH